MVCLLAIVHAIPSQQQQADTNQGEQAIAFDKEFTCIVLEREIARKQRWQLHDHKRIHHVERHESNANGHQQRARLEWILAEIDEQHE